MARQYDHLYAEITDFSNLLLAWRKAAKGKRSKQAAASFEMNLEDQLIRLQDELQMGDWRHGDYHSFRIRDPKERLISAAPFRDRVVHHALCQVINPLFERTFMGDSFANRKGKGTHAALDKAQKFMRRYPFVLQCDIKQFFPSIDHAVLKSILWRKIADKKVRWLMHQIITSGEGILDDEYTMVYFQKDDLVAAMRPRGLPIGNLTSQLWANVYMNELDQMVKRSLGCKAYLRYVDDFLLFADSKQQLWEYKDAIREGLSTLRLTLHERSSTVYPTRAGIPFLGFRLYDDHRRIKRKNAVNFSRRLQRNYRAYARCDLSRNELNERVQGWVAHVNHADTWGLRKSLLAKQMSLRVN